MVLSDLKYHDVTNFEPDEIIDLSIVSALAISVLQETERVT